MKRRDFIKASATSLVMLQCPAALALNNLGQAKTKKVIWIMLRGALDPLHTVLPVGDPDFATYRQSLVGPIQSRLLSLSSYFSLHPDLSFLHHLYQRKEMTPVVAVASGYRERSHFDGQDQLESGLNNTEHENGWLARALNQYRGGGVAVARTVPIALRGANKEIDTWYPSSFPEADEDTLARLADLYDDDEHLASLLAQAVEQSENPNMQMKETRRPKFPFLAQRCAELLRNEQDLSCGMLEMGGWDTHNNMSSRLSRQFSLLDEGIKNIQTELAERWQDTLIIISSEFGRTVKLNGTGGSDHGTGGVMFFAGGALKDLSESIQGGQVMGAWPGLHEDKLFEKRDLMPSSDIRFWLAEALKRHWDLSQSQIQAIFPDI
jgi:uncharacterized protein (DUF1501 family)